MIRVGERSKRDGFALEARAQLFITFWLKHLHGDSAVQLGLQRAIHHAGAALAEAALDLIASIEQVTRAQSAIVFAFDVRITWQRQRRQANTESRSCR